MFLEAVQVVVSGGERRGEKTNNAALQTFQNGGDGRKRRGPLIVGLCSVYWSCPVFIRKRPSTDACLLRLTGGTMWRSTQEVCEECVG